MYFKNSVAAIIVIFAIIAGTKTFFSGLVHVGYNDNLTVAERIKPSGQVYLEGDIDVNAIKALLKPLLKHVVASKCILQFVHHAMLLA